MLAEGNALVKYISMTIKEIVQFYFNINRLKDQEVLANDNNKYLKTLKNIFQINCTIISEIEDNSTVGCCHLLILIFKLAIPIVLVSDRPIGKQNL